MSNFDGMCMKFVVVKHEDMNRYLIGEDLERFKELLGVIEFGRLVDGKPLNTYLVVNIDETYAPQVAQIMKDNGHWGKPNGETE